MMDTVLQLSLKLYRIPRKLICTLQEGGLMEPSLLLITAHTVHARVQWKKDKPALLHYLGYIKPWTEQYAVLEHF